MASCRSFPAENRCSDYNTVADIRLASAAKWTSDPPMPHQLAAWNALQESLTPRQLADFAELFRAAPAPKPALTVRPGGSRPRVRQRPDGGVELLQFPYQYQTDNGPTGWRECQTTAISMCLIWMGTKGIRSDVDYLRIVNAYGDTTSQAAHAAALRHLNVRARFVTTCDEVQLLAELRAGLPAAIALAHNGPVGSPRDGHWVSVYGATAMSWMVNDPYGELDLISGGFAKVGPTAGKAITYSKQNTRRRWCVEGGSSGWAWLFS